MIPKVENADLRALCFFDSVNDISIFCNSALCLVLLLQCVWRVTATACGGHQKANTTIKPIE